MSESDPGTLVVEEHIAGRVAFVRRFFGSTSMMGLLDTPHFNGGKHEQAEHRINLILAALQIAGHVAEYRGGIKDILVGWVDEPSILLGDQKPMEYLGRSEVCSDSLWLGVAATALTGVITTPTDLEAAEFMENVQPNALEIEAEHKPTPAE